MLSKQKKWIPKNNILEIEFFVKSNRNYEKI